MLLILSVLLFAALVYTADIPLAPYNVKVFCRQGLRFTHPSQVAQECPSSATACGYLEFSFPHQNGLEFTGIFDCVESGMLKSDDDQDDEKDISQLSGNVLFAQLCGAQASCSSLSMEQLNPAFSRYLIIQHGVKLEEMRDSKVRFCCSLFHATLQKLIISGQDRLPTASASSMHCGGETCSPGAVGCLSHSMSSADSDEYEDRLIRRRRSDDDYEINAVEISFDDEEEDSSLVLVSRNPTTPPTTTYAPPNRTTKFLPSLNLPLVPPKLPPTKVKNGVKYAIIDEDEEDNNNDNDDDGDDDDEQHCVYRHLNDELYRWCLFVHQSKNGDRCYFHQGHTVCCCFAPPDTDTCDPTEPDLVVPGRQAKVPSIKITSKPYVETTTTSTTTTSTTTTTTTTTPPPTTIPTTVAITTTKSPSTRCRITYTKVKNRQRPVLVCAGCHLFPLLFLPVLLLL